MAAPEEPELSQAQTEKLLQFQVDSPKLMHNGCQFVAHVNEMLTPLATCPFAEMSVYKRCLPVNFDNAPPSSRQLELELTRLANIS